MKNFKRMKSTWDLLGISDNQELVFCYDSSIKCYTMRKYSSDRRVKYLGEEWYITTLTNKLLKKVSMAETTQGIKYWKYKKRILVDIYNENVLY